MNLVVYLGASTEDEGIEVEVAVRAVSIDNGADRSMPLTPLPANLGPSEGLSRDSKDFSNARREGGS